MIFNFLIYLVLLVLGSIFSLLPVVTLSSIPVIGPTFSSVLLRMTQIWNSTIETVPYLGISWQVFLYVIIPFELIMLLSKFLLGHRSPSNSH